MASLKHRVEELERQQSPRPSHSALFDDDALMIYSGMAYLDATVEPTYHDVEQTEVYCRGEEVRDGLYGPIVPAHLHEHIRRYTRASGEELTFGREPRTGDMLRYEALAPVVECAATERVFPQPLSHARLTFPGHIHRPTTSV